MEGFASQSDVERIMNKISSGKPVSIKPVSEKEVKQATQKFAREEPRKKTIEEAKEKSKEQVPTKAKTKQKKKKAKKKSQLLSRLSKVAKKKVTSKRILKKSNVQLRIPNRPISSNFDRGSSFFSDVWEQTKNGADPLADDGFFWR